MNNGSKNIFIVLMLLISSCGSFTDPATRIAYDIEESVKQLKKRGDKYTLYHKTPSKTGECEGPYKVQFDKVGALIIWCNNEAGDTISSHSTSYHGRFVDTPETYILDKGAGETLVIELERHSNKAVILSVR